MAGVTETGDSGDIERAARTRVTLTDISSRAWEHPADRGALTALRQLKGNPELIEAEAEFLALKTKAELDLGKQRMPRVFPTEWNVPPIRRRVSTVRSVSTRRSMSRDALLVKVRSRIRAGSVPDSIRRDTR